MAIPNNINATIPSGIAGEIASDTGISALPAVVSSASASNVFGRAFTYDDAALETVKAGGAGKFAGLLISPKTYANEDGVLPKGQAGELLFEGEVFVNLNAAAVIGDPIHFVPATGALSPTVTDNTVIVGARVVRHNSAPVADGVHLAIARLTQ